MGKLYVAGIGPGNEESMTIEAQTALRESVLICGYTVYVDLLRPMFPEKEFYTTGMTGEIERCRYCLEAAATGKTVALVCSGDAGVYGMAGLVMELAPEYPADGQVHRSVHKDHPRHHSRTLRRGSSRRTSRA